MVGTAFIDYNLYQDKCMAHTTFLLLTLEGIYQMWPKRISAIKIPNEEVAH